MARIRFIQPGEPSQKKGYVASARYRKRWKVAFIISGVINALSISYIIFKYFNN